MKMLTKKTNLVSNKGFSLLEMLVAMTVLTTILFILSSMVESAVCLIRVTPLGEHRSTLVKIVSPTIASVKFVCRKSAPEKSAFSSLVHLKKASRRSA